MCDTKKKNSSSQSVGNQDVFVGYNKSSLLPPAAPKESDDSLTSSPGSQLDRKHSGAVKPINENTARQQAVLGMRSNVGCEEGA